MKFCSDIPVFLLLVVLATAVVKLSTPPKNSVQGPRDVASINPKQSFKAQQSRRIQKQNSPFQSRKVVLRRALKTKPADEEGSSPGAHKSATSRQQFIPAETELAALIDNTCVKTSYRADLSKTLTASLNASNLKYQAYSMFIRTETALSDLESRVQDDECILGVAENAEVEADAFLDDPRSDEQFHLENIRARDSEDFFYASSLSPSSHIVIAIIDSGIDYEHPDLSSHMWVNDQGHFGYDFVNDDSNPMDDNEHGTHVAGLAAASGGNNKGVAGVMPSGVRLMAIKVLDDNGSGTFKDVANGIRFAVENGADLINVSLSGGGDNALVKDALIFAVNSGVPVVVSAGNDDIEIGDEWDEFKMEGNARTPSSMAKDIDGVISVGSIDSVSSEKSPFSNYSSEYVEIAAPGSNGLLSTLPDDSYGNMNGTSMSSPIVAGAIGLMIRTFKSIQFAYTPAEVEEILFAGSDEKNSLKPFFKNGRHLNLDLLKTQLRYNVVAPLSAGVDDAF